jgi:UDP-GlcNAc3NAcA epimerase
MKLISIVGARPQFIKLAPLAREIDRHNALDGALPIEHRIVHTGQHYDVGMSDVFFDELDLPVADFKLPSCPGSHAQQTAAIVSGVERVLEQEQPDVVGVYGDTNSTLAGALAATKLHMTVAHVEAGLRSFNRRMPEEINRLVADHVSDVLLAPTPTAMQNLAAEGLVSRSVFTGDLMYDNVLHYRDVIERSPKVLSRLGLTAGEYGLVTFHRANNTDDRARLLALLTVLNEIAAKTLSLVFPLHPRTATRMHALLPGWRAHPQLQLVEPVGYLDTLTLLNNARVALTDSGGLQKEAFFLGCPCVTLRSETEWIETIDAAANILADAEPARIRSAVASWGERYAHGRADFSPAVGAAFGHGDAARRILAELLRLQNGSPEVPDHTLAPGPEAVDILMETIRE